jgi:catechol 2,3-dioxygenase-like lactoylglutathione lyase family enzyme
MQTTTQERSSDGFRFESSIPVIRMLDEAKAKAFYVNFLGFTIDWEHRFNETAPLYMQVRHGDAILHLNGHAGEDSPVSEVRIPVRGVEGYCQYLREKVPGDSKPCLVDPRGKGEGTDMNIYDPSGNLLTFWKVRPRGGGELTPP